MIRAICFSAFLDLLTAAALLLLGQADSAGAPARTTEDPKDAQPSFRTVLNWLPPDTETLVVTKGPFPIEVRTEYSDRSRPLIKYLEGFSYATLGSLHNGTYLKKLEGQEVALAVEGARAFRHPSGLGGALYEGCHILVFKQDLGTAGGALRKAWAADAIKTEQIEGHDVYAFEEKFEQDVWKLFFAKPAANVVVCATDRAYLRELLGRVARHQEKRAFPDDLPEWKHVDRNARCWAIRHFGKPPAKDAVQSLLSEDPQAVGLVFNHTPSEKKEAKSSASVKYLSANERAREIATRAWNYSAKPTGRPTVRQSAAGVVELTVELDEEQGPEFLFILLLHLGHAIAV